MMFIRTIIAGIYGFYTFSCPAMAELPGLDQARARGHCEEQWTKRGVLDQSMFNYCMERQREGYNEAGMLAKKYAQLEDLDNIVAYAASKWLRAREYQYEMVAYEIEQQIDAVLNISFDMKAGKYTEEMVLRCVGKWYSPKEPQWDMVEYCLRD